MNTINKDLAIALLGAVPDMDENIENGWIYNPTALKKILAEALCPPKIETIGEKFDAMTIRQATPYISFLYALAATGREQDIDEDAIGCVPSELLHQRGREVFLAPIHQGMDNESVEERYGKDSEPCDPWKLCRIDCEGIFSDEKPYLTHWQNTDGKWHYLAFHNLRGKRWVDVSSGVNAANGYWHSARVRK